MAGRVAVLADVHGNLWALRAVLDDVRRTSVDLIVNCGDLLLGPWPSETVDELFGCGIRVVSVRGNSDRVAADAFDGRWHDVPPPARAIAGWVGKRLRPEDRRVVGGMPLTANVDVDGLGAVTCFHATPRCDDEILLPTSDERRVRDLLAETAPLAVYGHVHLQDDRYVADRRVINAGSVGMPFDAVGAAWVLLGPGVEMRRTDYDTAAAMESAREQFKETPEGQEVADAFAASLVPPGRAAILAAFAKAEARPLEQYAARSLLAQLD